MQLNLVVLIGLFNTIKVLEKGYFTRWYVKPQRKRLRFSFHLLSPTDQKKKGILAGKKKTSFTKYICNFVPKKLQGAPKNLFNKSLRNIPRVLIERKLEFQSKSFQSKRRTTTTNPTHTDILTDEYPQVKRCYSM